jgi:hypothetical protein
MSEASDHGSLRSVRRLHGGSDDLLDDMHLMPMTGRFTPGDLCEVGCDLLTVTQYLRPRPRYHPARRCVLPEEFDYLREVARLQLLLSHVRSAGHTPSRAGRLFKRTLLAGTLTPSCHCRENAGPEATASDSSKDFTVMRKRAASAPSMIWWSYDSAR